MPIANLRDLAREAMVAAPNARLHAVKKNGQVELVFSTKPRSLYEKVTGAKATRARKEIRRLVGQEMQSGNKQRAYETVKTMDYVRRQHNVKHALTPRDVEAILFPMFGVVKDKRDKEKSSSSSEGVLDPNEKGKEREPLGDAQNIDDKGNVAEPRNAWDDIVDDANEIKEYDARKTIDQRAREGAPKALDALERTKTKRTGESMVRLGVLRPFLEAHTDAALDLNFWREQHVRGYEDKLGCGLALIMIQRVMKKGTISPEDAVRLRRALQPTESADKEKTPDYLLTIKKSNQLSSMLDDLAGPSMFVPLPRGLAGDLTKEKLAAILVSFRSKYLEGDMPINLIGDRNLPQKVVGWINDCIAQPDAEVVDGALAKIFDAWDKTCGANSMYVGYLIDGMKCAIDPSRLEPKLHDDQSTRSGRNDLSTR